MRISKLLMPAVTVAGALALAGCGGGSDAPANPGGGGLSDEQKLAAEIKKCTDAGNYWDGSKCVDKPEDMTDKQARDAATALREKIAGITIGDTLTATDNRPGSSVEDADKKIAAFRGEGETFAELQARLSGVIGAVIGTGQSNEGYYPLTTSTTTRTVKGFSDGAGRTSTDNGATVSGEYQGIKGTFKCSGTNGVDCTSRPSGSGGYVLGAGWLFKPDSATDKSEGPALAEWGWWINRNDDDAVDTVGLVYGLASGSPEGARVLRTDFTNHPGSATYKGKAYGQYAVVERGSGSASGAFEAQADLTATFGTTARAAKLKGEIHTFNVGSGWKVTLEENDGTPSDANTFSGSTVWSMGSDEGLDKGVWNARMYGNDADGSTDNSAPSHILGAFDATHDGASLAGAFGTKKE